MKLQVGTLDSSAGLSLRYGGGLWFLAAGLSDSSLSLRGSKAAWRRHDGEIPLYESGFPKPS